MAVKRYRTKPVEIEAVQYDGNPEALVRSMLNTNFSGAQFKGGGHGYGGLSVYDYLQDTWVKVNVGDYIIRGTKGEFYPCDPETFEWKYEELGRKIHKVEISSNRAGPVSPFKPVG